MNYSDVELNGKTIRLESSVLTLEKYRLLTGRDMIDDWVADNKNNSEIAKIMLKYGVNDYVLDFDKLVPENQIALNEEIKAIRQESNKTFFRDVIVAMIMAGEYPQERTKESIWRDIPAFPQNNEVLAKVFDELFSQIIDPDTKKKVTNLVNAKMNQEANTHSL